MNAKKRKEDEAVRRILEHENSFKVMNKGETEEASICEEENFLDLRIAETKAPTFSMNHSKLKHLMRCFDVKDLLRKFEKAIIFDDVDEQKILKTPSAWAQKRPRKNFCVQLMTVKMNTLYLTMH